MTAKQQMFLAVVPPPEIIDAIDDLPTRAQRGVRYTKLTQWHITTRFLGLADPQAAVTALDTLDAAAAQVTLGPQVALLGSRVVMIPASGLDAVAAAAREAFAEVGEPQPERDYNGHLTLARLKGAPLRDPTTVAVLDAPISATFLAESLVLFATEVTKEGATHTVVAEKVLDG